VRHFHRCKEVKTVHITAVLLFQEQSTSNTVYCHNTVSSSCLDSWNVTNVLHSRNCMSHFRTCRY